MVDDLLGVAEAGLSDSAWRKLVPGPAAWLEFAHGIGVTAPIVAAVRSMLDRTAEGWKESAP
jgi:hypothetical protein